MYPRKMYILKRLSKCYAHLNEKSIKRKPYLIFRLFYFDYFIHRMMCIVYTKCTNYVLDDICLNAKMRTCTIQILCKSYINNLVNVIYQ